MGERGPKKGHAYGAAAIANVFKNAQFPMSKHEIMECYGNNEVEYTKGNPQKLKKVLDNLPEKTYKSPADLEHEISRIM